MDGGKGPGQEPLQQKNWAWVGWNCVHIHSRKSEKLNTRKFKEKNMPQSQKQTFVKKIELYIL